MYIYIYTYTHTLSIITIRRGLERDDLAKALGHLVPRLRAQILGAHYHYHELVLLVVVVLSLLVVVVCLL